MVFTVRLTPNKKGSPGTTRLTGGAQPVAVLFCSGDYYPPPKNPFSFETKLREKKKCLSLEPEEHYFQVETCREALLRVQLNGEHTSEWILTGAEEQRYLCAAFECCRKRRSQTIPTAGKITGKGSFSIIFQ